MHAIPSPHSLSQIMVIQTVILVSLVSYSAATMTNSWAVKLSGGEQVADILARKHGLVNLGQVGELKNVYHFKKLNSKQMDDVSDEYPVADHITQQLNAEKQVGFAEQQERKMLYKRGYDVPNDKKWPLQWSLDNRGQIHAADVGHDIKAEKAWLQQVTGCGVTVGVVDDGVEYNNTDLTANYVPALQRDIIDDDDDPFPEDTDGVRNRHGTSCAGIITMSKGNGACGVGVAYNAKITGLRILASNKGATAIEEATALTWKMQDIDVYSNSWGPSDTGAAVSGPGATLMEALKQGVTNGRQGKGSIYTFAAGNGGENVDSCAADGYISNIYTIAVGSISNDGAQSYYDEQCSSKLVVAYTDDPYRTNPYRDVVTTNVFDGCRTDFIGTSASTPLVSGAVALLLEVNPALTWRDVQYLIVYTSKTSGLVDGEWTINGAGLQVSHKFGFGVIDAEAIISRGRHWINVPPQVTTEVPQSEILEVRGESKKRLDLQFNDGSIKFLEHVEVTFSLKFSRQPGERGKIEVRLTSPSGTTSTLLSQRPADKGSLEFKSWPLISVHHWGEDPAGVWTLTVDNNNGNPKAVAEVTVPEIIFYGTSEVPEAVARIPAECSLECDPTRGCADVGMEYCDACAELREASSLACTSKCAPGEIEYNRYCYENAPESPCSA